MSPTQGHPRSGGGCATNTAFRQCGAAETGVPATRPGKVRRAGSPCSVAIRRRGRRAQIKHGTWDPWIDPHPGKSARSRRHRGDHLTNSSPTHRGNHLTNNTSEKMHKSPKTHQKESRYWHTPATLTRFRHACTYLVSARNHGVRAIDHAPDGPSHHPADCMTQGSSVEWVRCLRPR